MCVCVCVCVCERERERENHNIAIFYVCGRHEIHIVYLCRFFFQGCGGNVLYTGECIVYITGEKDRERESVCVCICVCVFYAGDFRLTLEETKRLRSLHSGGRYVYC